MEANLIHEKSSSKLESLEIGNHIFSSRQKIQVFFFQIKLKKTSAILKGVRPMQTFFQLFQNFNTCVSTYIDKEEVENKQYSTALCTSRQT